MSKTITGVVTWLKGWFFDKDEIITKEQALQTQINNKASTSDLNTTNGNVTNLSNNKADKSGGVAQITDSTAGSYSNIGNLSNGATQKQINTAIDNRMGGMQTAINDLLNVGFMEIVTELPTGNNIKQDTIYFKANGGNENRNLYDVFVYINNAWEQLDSFSIDLTGYATESFVTSRLNVDSIMFGGGVYLGSYLNNLQSTVNGKANASHAHGNITTDGKITNSTSMSSYGTLDKILFSDASDSNKIKVSSTIPAMYIDGVEYSTVYGSPVSTTLDEYVAEVELKFDNIDVPSNIATILTHINTYYSMYQ